MRPFSIVIVTWNSAREIEPLLASIIAHLPVSTEIIVVDNASEDGTPYVASRRSRITVMALGANLGFGGANNVGVRRARHDVVVMLNPDTLLIDDSLTQLADVASRSNALCGPEILSDDYSRQPSASPMPAGWEVGVNAFWPGLLMPQSVRTRCEPWRATSRVEVGWLTGACVAAPRSLLLKLGPFDERLHLYAEDMDLGVRARLEGFRSLFAPDAARVIHYGDRSVGQRFQDRGLALAVRNRRRVVRWRLGPIRDRYDFATQIVYHGLRYSAKGILGRDNVREREWLKTAGRLLRRHASD